MRATRLALLVIALSSGCASPPEPPVAPAAPPPAAVSPQEAARRQAEEVVAKMQAEQRRLEAQMRESAAAQAQAIEQAQAAANAAQRERIQRAAAQCEDSRPARAAELQEQIRKHQARVAKVAPHLKAISARCVEVDTSRTRVKRVLDGVRVEHVGGPELDCHGPVPGGLSVEDLAFAMGRLGISQVGAEPASFSLPAEHDALNDRCRDADKAAGYQPFVARDDAEGTRRVLEWRRPNGP